MLNPGSFPLCAFAIGANARQSGAEIDDLDGMKAVTLQLAFVYGSGGGVKAAKAYVQTSLDKGESWIDIACVTFSQANKEIVLTLKGDDALAAYTPLSEALADDTQQGGILGDRLRVIEISAGTVYGGNTALTGWVSAK